MDDGRKEQLVAQITARLERLCEHMTDDEFAAMVREIARITMKYEGGPGPAPSASRWRAPGAGPPR